ncbi:MAG: flagellar hook-associated protein FlgK [Acidobacteria bacterium]|nr:flagellar hook-associated protein FlgK [Acidobacteriota bacterium]MBI3657030.1 flagellar hook-associated protein FlgK [Acidobacteriota bacterium]
MMTLFSNLYLGLSALRSQQLALSIAGNNVANVNTPGYSRQRAIMAELDPLQISEGQLGRGVRILEINAARDRFIEARLVKENQGLGQFDIMNQNLQQIEALFADSGGTGIRDALTKFFNSFSDLANNPTSIATRQQVLIAGNNVAGSIRNSYAQMVTTQSIANQGIKTTIDQINGLTDQIAKLNTQVASVEALGQDSTRFRDQRQLLVGQLGQLANISYMENDARMVTVQINGRSLVENGNATALAATLPPSGSPNFTITMNGNNITSEVTSGKLGGLLQVRDVNIPGYLQTLDTMAGALITQVNTIHSGGFDLTRAVGGSFFTPPSVGASAAQTIAVAITDPARIAAATTLPPSGPPGDNSNARALANLATARISSLGSVTFSEYYGTLVARVGGQAREAADGLKTQRQIVRQVQNLRDSVSGVSLDEEMASIIQYQKAYEASARFVSIVNALTDETIRILGSGR